MDRLLEFAGNHPYLMSGAVFLTALALYNEFRQLSRHGVDLTPNDAVMLINRGATVIDLRGIERYQSGHIVNAKHVPMEQLSEAAGKKLKGLKNNAVVVYDDNGIAAGRAVTLLRKLDFEQVVNLRGGLAAWERENLPLERK